MNQNPEHQPTHAIFYEEQRFTQWWIYLIIAAAVIFAWWMFLQQIVFDQPVGNDPGPDWIVWIVFFLIGIGMPLFFATLKLRTWVYPEHISLRFLYFHHRRIPLESIVSFEAREYRPIMEFGGWGIRWVPGKGMAYNVKGNKGVELKLSSGKLLMIGSQEHKKLERAIRQAKESTP